MVLSIPLIFNSQNFFRLSKDSFILLPSDSKKLIVTKKTKIPEDFIDSIALSKKNNKDCLSLIKLFFFFNCSKKLWMLFRPFHKSIK